MTPYTDSLVFGLCLAFFLVLNYLVFAYGGYWFFYTFLGPSIQHRKILEKDATSAQMKSEKIRSFTTQIMYLTLGMCLYGMYKMGWTQIYTQWDERGILYFFASFFIVHQIHDAYFYWTHRLMHEWKPIRKYHFVHHESAPPTPFSALSFHPVEAFVHGMFWILIGLIVPVPVFWLFGFYTFMFYINMWGHTSFEFWHRDLTTHPVLKALNTPTHHNLHHKYHQANYSIYYNFWDKVCGTNHPEYEAHYKEVKAKTEKGKSSRLMKLMKL